MRDNIALINDSCVEMSGQMVAINNLILSLSAISEENAAGAQQSSASIVEQTKLLDAMSASSSDLAKLANKMEANVSVFRTESDEAMHLEENFLEDAVVSYAHSYWIFLYQLYPNRLPVSSSQTLSHCSIISSLSGSVLSAFMFCSKLNFRLM
jgi:hypothetical protein